MRKHLSAETIYVGLYVLPRGYAYAANCWLRCGRPGKPAGLGPEEDRSTWPDPKHDKLIAERPARRHDPHRALATGKAT